MAEPLRIDAHMHIYRTREEGFQQKAGGYVIWEYGDKPDVRFSHYGGNLEDALEAIDKSAFSKAVVVNLFTVSRDDRNAVSGPQGGADALGGSQSLAARLREFNTWACELARPLPQLVPFVAADPGVLPGDEGAAHIRDMVENHGARGIKLHPVLQGFHMADRRMWPMYGACQELGIPIVAHSGPSRGGEPYAEPHAFEETLKAFPELKIVLAHMGGGTWRQALEVARTYPNAYFDCCEIIQWTGASNAPSDYELARLIRDIGPERVMMGSDFPWYDLDHCVERIMELPVLSNEEKQAILGANAARIMGLQT